jgi:DNA-binding GntR family transcriptional regulator
VIEKIRVVGDACSFGSIQCRVDLVAIAGENEDLFLETVDLQRLSTGEQVARALREAILSGRLAPGAHLREAVLADAFGVSRNTVRGAIQVLARDGLVTHRVHRGAFVTELEPAGISDVYATRRLVELSALEEVPPADALLPLEAALAGLRRAIDGGGDDQIRDADLDFHRAVADLRGSPRLATLFAEMEAETRLSTLLVGNSHPEPEDLYRQSREILELLRAGDVAEARALLDRRLQDSEKQLLDELAKKRGEAA